MAAQKIDPRLRADFREIARDIVHRDRTARKNQVTQNTIGEIERAMARAFELGLKLANAPPLSRPGPDAALAWEEVPLRGRDVLISLTYRSASYVHTAIGLRPISEDDKIRWVEAYPDDCVGSRGVAAGSVNGLIRQRLISENADGVWVLTPKGRETCETYWRRREQNDPLLPRESLRL